MSYRLATARLLAQILVRNREGKSLPQAFTAKVSGVRSECTRRCQRHAGIRPPSAPASCHRLHSARSSKGQRKRSWLWRKACEAVRAPRRKHPFFNDDAS
eukprot:331604-Rhodomonas_salina.1